MINFDFYIKQEEIGKVIEYGNITVESDETPIALKYAKVIRSDQIIITYEFETAMIDYLAKTITIGE